MILSHKEHPGGEKRHPGRGAREGGAAGAGGQGHGAEPPYFSQGKQFTAGHQLLLKA